MSKTERIGNLEHLLISRPQGCKVSELVGLLGVHRSQIYRDLETLGQSGVPIVHDETDELWYIDSTRYLAKVHLTAAESLILFLAARRLLRQMHMTVPVTLMALSKLATALRQPIAEQLSRVTSEMYSRDVDTTRDQVWQVLTQGWVEQRAVEITHRKFQNPIAQHYTLHPYLFEPHIWGESTYVIGYCPERSSLRTFKVERIEHATLTNTRFEVPADLDANRLLANAWGIWYDPERPPVLVKVRFAPAVAQRIKETIWHPSQRLTELTDGGLYWEVEVAEVLELLGWIRSWGPDAEVLEPPSLRQRVAEDFRKVSALYG